MNNIDLIIKYEQGLLNEKEKVKFEEKLKISIELQNAYEAYKIKLNLLTEKVEVNEQYFANLIPNVRSRIEKEKTFSIFSKITYSIPVLILLMIATYSLVERNRSKLEYNFDELLTSFSNDEETMENLFANVLLSEDDYLLVENNLVELSDINKDELDNLFLNEIENSNSENYFNNEIVDEEFIQQFSKEQFDEVYAALITKNIL